MTERRARERRKAERRKAERRQEVPAAYAGLEQRNGLERRDKRNRRSGRDRRKATPKSRQRHMAAQAKSLISLIVVVALVWGALYFFTSSPSDAMASEELTERFRYSGAYAVIVEGRGIRVYLDTQYEEAFREGGTAAPPIVKKIAKEYNTLTGRTKATLYIYIRGKLVGKVKA